MLYKAPKELILLKSAFHNEQKLQDKTEFYHFSQTFTKGEFVGKPSLYFVYFTCLRSRLIIISFWVIVEFTHI